MNVITITKHDDCGFTVATGQHTAPHLTFEEMLGLVATLTMPPERRCLQWLETQEQRTARAAARESRIADCRAAEAVAAD